jgi:hypothetical protein
VISVCYDDISAETPTAIPNLRFGTLFFCAFKYFVHCPDSIAGFSMTPDKSDYFHHLSFKCERSECFAEKSHGRIAK